MRWQNELDFSPIWLFIYWLSVSSYGFIPNLIWAKNQPEGYSAEGESKLLQTLERIGQVLITSMSLCFADLNFRPWTAWSGWLLAAAAFMVMYEGFWLRYFRGERTLEDFYGRFWGVPVAGATLPVLAAVCLGIYGKNLWYLLAAIALGVGHIGIHLQHRRGFEEDQGK